MDALNIGIDVAKDRLDVAANTASLAPFHLPRDHGGLADLVERLKPLGAERIAVEATGGFPETVVVAALAAAGLPVVVVNPAQVRAFAHALGKRAKTDPIDAAVIARFAEATRPELRPLADAQTQALADLVARRRQIIAMIGALVGLAPWTRQSGQWRGKSFIGGGRAAVRTALSMGALVAAGYNPSLRAFRDRLVAQGKPKLVAIIAVARKLVTILNAIIRDQQPWREQTA